MPTGRGSCVVCFRYPPTSGSLFPRQWHLFSLGCSWSEPGNENKMQESKTILMLSDKGANPPYNEYMYQYKVNLFIFFVRGEGFNEKKTIKNCNNSIIIYIFF